VLVLLIDQEKGSVKHERRGEVCVEEAVCVRFESADWGRDMEL